ncbi:MAG: hypothetical protein H0X37_00600 [Herpetosiphonaceae bacterium]|nr:hypothetical protein [Herpetosiphonaceae bacterium]
MDHNQQQRAALAWQQFWQTPLDYAPATYQQPQITLHQTSDPTYFPVGVKHRYTRAAMKKRG